MTEATKPQDQTQGRARPMTDEISVATYSLTEGDNGSQVSIIFSDGTTETLTDRQPNFEAIKEALHSKPEGYGPVVYDLANVAKTVGRKFRDLSPRVTTDGTEIFFDGDPVHSTLSQFILKLLREDAQKAAEFFKGTSSATDADDSKVTWQALVKFLENLYSNPNPESRESLYGFIEPHGLTIDKDGYFIAYKGLEADFGSVNKGYGIVDGVEVNGTLYNLPGSVLRFPRKDVDSNTSVGCSQGLHAGTHSYASGWNRGKLVAVRINPMNVVSVPKDCSFQKLRVCEYEVLHEVDPLEIAVATGGWESNSLWDDDYDGSGSKGYDESIYELTESDVVSFDYISLDGDEQHIAEATIEDFGYDDFNAFVPAKDGYRTFKFSGISNLAILDQDEDAEEVPEEETEEDVIRDLFGKLNSEADEDVIGDLFEKIAETGDGFFQKIEDTLKTGVGVSDFLKGLIPESVLPEDSKDLIPADIREKAKKVFEDSGFGEVFDIFGAFRTKDEAPAESKADAEQKNEAAPEPTVPSAPKAEDKSADGISLGDTVSFDYVSLDGATQHVADAEVQEVQAEHFKAWVPAKDGYRTFKFNQTSNLEVAQVEAQPAEIHAQIRALKIGDRITVVLEIDGQLTTVANATVLLLDDITVTVRLTNNGYRVFTANDVASISVK